MEFCRPPTDQPSANQAPVFRLELWERSLLGMDLGGPGEETCSYVQLYDDAYLQRGRRTANREKAHQHMMRQMPHGGQAFDLVRERLDEVHKNRKSKFDEIDQNALSVLNEATSEIFAAILGLPPPDVTHEI